MEALLGDGEAAIDGVGSTEVGGVGLIDEQALDATVATRRAA
jgi:hypothetical protein